MTLQGRDIIAAMVGKKPPISLGELSRLSGIGQKTLSAGVRNGLKGPQAHTVAQILGIDIE